MGSGKSTAGRDLASRLGYAFVDGDEAIRERTGKTPAEMFETAGEAAFRAVELETLSDLLNLERTVLSPGGGAFAQARGAQLLLDRAFTIHLACEFEEAFRRSTAEGGRPLLAAGEEAARALYRERKDKYARAHASVDTTRLTPGEVVEELIRLVESSGHPKP